MKRGPEHSARNLAVLDQATADLSASDKSRFLSYLLGVLGQRSRRETLEFRGPAGFPDLWIGEVMGLIFRKRIRLGKGLWLNLSKSGVSVSTRIGSTTLNNRGRVTARLGKGIYWRKGK